MAKYKFESPYTIGDKVFKAIYTTGSDIGGCRQADEFTIYADVVTGIIVERDGIRISTESGHDYEPRDLFPTFNEALYWLRQFAEEAVDDDA